MHQLLSIYMPHATSVLQWGFHFGNKNEIQVKHKYNTNAMKHKVCLFVFIGH